MRTGSLAMRMAVFLLLNNKAPSHFYKDTLLFEHHTSGTDAFDTLHIGCEKFAQHVF